MSPYASSSNARSLIVRYTAIAAAAMSLSACSTAPSRPAPQNLPLVVVSCPPRTPLADDSFGAWVLKAQELAQAYDRCRAAALASK